MSNLNNLSLSDFQRLSMEIGTSTENAADWAERIGIDPDLVQEIGQVGLRMVFGRMQDAAEEIYGKSIQEAIEDDEEPIPLDFGHLIVSACVSAFVLGWEGCKEYGTPGRDMSQGEDSFRVAQDDSRPFWENLGG